MLERSSRQVHVLTAFSMACFCVLAGDVTAQDSCFQKLFASDGAGGNRFGSQVHIDGETLLVDTRAGRVYIFERENGVWEESARLTRPAGAALSSALSGDRFIAGARNRPPIAMRREAGTWVSDGVLAPEGALPAAYGQYCALSGNLAAVTAHDAGEVHFFRHDGTGWVRDGIVRREWLFGWTIDLDGDRAVVGDYSAPSGTPNGAVVLRRTETDGVGEWEVEAELGPSDGCEMFGADVAISGDVVVVGGAPDFAGPDSSCARVYVHRFDREGSGQWLEEQILAPEGILTRDRFGVGVSVDGDVVAIGAMGDSQFESGSGLGTLFAYRHDGSQWVPAASIAQPDRVLNVWFARGVSVSGSTLVTGAPNDSEIGGSAGAAYTIQLGPQAGFTMSPASPVVGEEVTFDASSSVNASGSEIAAYRWNLGEVEAEGVVVAHSYSRPGRHRISLLAADEDGGCGDASGLLTVSCPEGDPGAWTSGAVGVPGFPGSANLEGEAGSEELSLCAGGANIQTWSGDDECQFVYREVTGDVVITARVREISPIRGGKLGLMLRENLDVRARHATILFENATLDPTSGRFRFVRREERDGSARASSGDTGEAPDVWIQLRREGDEFIGLSSVDGESWTEVHRVDLDLPEILLAGVAVSGRDAQADEPYSPLLARITEPAITRPMPLDPAFLRGDPNADGTQDLSDGVAVLDFLFQGDDAPTCIRSADVNDSGAVDVSDAIHLLGYLFLGGSPPPPPGSECGRDPTPDTLTCIGHAPCS